MISGSRGLTWALSSFTDSSPAAFALILTDGCVTWWLCDLHNYRVTQECLQGQGKVEVNTQRQHTWLLKPPESAALELRFKPVSIWTRMHHDHLWVSNILIGLLFEKQQQGRVRELDRLYAHPMITLLKLCYLLLIGW